MTDPTLTLYSFWRSTAAYRVRVAARLKQLAIDERFIDLDAGEQHDDAFQRMNPMAAVPALIVEAGDNARQTLTESLAIIEYLDTLAPESPLVPEDPIARAKARAIAQTTAADIHPLIVPRIGTYLKKNAGMDDDAWLAWRRHWIETGLAGIERQLAHDEARQTYFGGETITIADICVTAIVVIARVIGIRIDGLPIIEAAVTRCESLTAFADSAPMRQPGAPES